MIIPLSKKQLSVLNQFNNQKAQVQAQLDLILDMIIESWPDKDKVGKITKINNEGIHYEEKVAEVQKPELVKE